MTFTLSDNITLYRSQDLTYAASEAMTLTESQQMSDKAQQLEQCRDETALQALHGPTLLNRPMGARDPQHQQQMVCDLHRRSSLRHALARNRHVLRVHLPGRKSPNVRPRERWIRPLELKLHIEEPAQHIRPIRN